MALRMAGLAMAAILGIACAAHAQGVTLQNAAPVVVTTMPAAGQGDVDPATTEVRVTFSKAMQPGGWSWVELSPGNTPKITGTPQFAPDQRTAVLPVRLEAGKVYALWVNSAQATNFRDPEGRVAVPSSAGVSNPKIAKGRTNHDKCSGNLARGDGHCA